MPHRDFEVERRAEPITFSYAGQTYRCIDELPWPVLEDLMGKINEAGNNEIATALQIGPFYRTVILDEDLPVFEEVLASKETPTGIKKLVEITQWLVEVYTGRPTDRPGSSHSGPSAPETKSRVVSLQRGTVEEVG